MISGLDHIALIVRDLAAAEARTTALFGRAPNWRGEDHGAANVWYELDNMAFDIIAPSGPGFAGDMARAHLARASESLWALAFATPDLDACHRRISRCGVSASPPFDLRSTHPESGATRVWRIAQAPLSGVTALFVEQKPDAPRWPAAPAEAAAPLTGLDHVVIRTPAPDRAAAIYGARLGLDMRLDRSSPDWGARLLFFRCGDLIVEIAHDLKAGVSDSDDALWGLTWRTDDIDAAHGRIAAAGFNLSDVRTGRRPGTRVFTVRDAAGAVPTLVIGPG